MLYALRTCIFVLFHVIPTLSSVFLGASPLIGDITGLFYHLMEQDSKILKIVENFAPADVKNSGISVHAGDESVSSGAAGPKLNIILL